MLLAFLIDQIQEHACRVFQLARARWHSRRYLWERFRALFFTLYVPNWEALMAAWADPSVLQFTLPTPRSRTLLCLQRSPGFSVR